ncbi:MAG: hypothetical protein KAW93_03200 [Methanogenium sp.]|nr:hypothetical protein [Methanogenium sp.]
MSEKTIVCPKCGKKTVVVEQPDGYEIWLKCSECDYFQGMSNDDWHRIHNSPNLDEKIKKMYEKEHGKAPLSTGPAHTCRACSSATPEGDGGVFGLCKSCCYKLLIILLVLMVIGSYMAWMALL